MRNLQAYRSLLSEIAELLDKGRDQKYASSVRTALSGDEKTIEKFLVSNTLWGGAESIADSALLGEGFVGFDRLATLRKRFTRLMADLGRLQLQDRKANPRTPTWLEVFEKSLADKR